MSKTGLKQVLVELSSDPKNLWEYVHNPDGYLEQRKKVLTDREMDAITSCDQKYIRRVLGRGWDCFHGIIHHPPGDE